MRQVFIQRGRVTVENVPAPLVERDHVLVEVAYSLISAGTEIDMVKDSGASLLRMTLEQPGRAKQVLDHLRRQGIPKTVAAVQGKRASLRPSGYSCAGIVVQTGPGVADVQRGDRVACAGAGLANHAEVVLVPRNLVVKVPGGCGLRDAASVTLGAIAMQGLRRANPRLGEIVAVIGLGLLGQITVQLLKASGCRVIGFDLEHRRVALARDLGMDHGFLSEQVDLESEIFYLTAGHGVDSTIITAASDSDAIVQQAMLITRRKGRVVVVGDVGLGLERSPFYQKEIDLLISCSYGPGRYDARYEKQGLDYPYAYVRWTENRNMAEYLRLLAEGKINIEPILEREYDVEKAVDAYKALEDGPEKPLGVVLAYSQERGKREEKLATSVVLKPPKASNKIRVAVVGAGSFAKSTHLPNLQRLSSLYHLRAIVSATGSNAKATAEQFGAEYATTNYDDVLTDASIDMVIICTRHNLHAPMATKAARAGKAIFLEKPMALHQGELEDLIDVLEETRVPFMVGFNRRFSPAARQAREVLEGHQNPLMILYRVNAGYLPPDHWTQTEEGGGRIIGEACHMLDLFQYFVSPAAVAGATCSAISSKGEHVSPTDNVAATIRYNDGSVATLVYTALGAKGLPKEYVEIYADGKVLVIDDYKTLRVHGHAAHGWKSRIQNKGHLEELRTLAQCIRQRDFLPIPLGSLIEVTRMTMAIAQEMDAECSSSRQCIGSAPCISDMA